LALNSEIQKYGDEQLLAHYRKTEDREVIGELFTRYRHLVFGACLKYLKNADDARDATLSLFEKLMRDLKNHDVQQFRYWLFTVCRNHCLMILRSRNTQASLLRGYAATEQDDSTDEWVLNREEALRRLEQLIEQLNEQQRLCVRLFYLEEKSYKEIVSQTALSLNEVKSHIQNGRRNLKILMTGKS
jgi:RNA polymerase sigma factor (sigma-70 family)